MQSRIAFLSVYVILVAGLRGFSADPAKPNDSSQIFKAKLQTALTTHLNELIKSDGSLKSFKGKSAVGSGALTFYLMFEMTGEQKYRQAAITLADDVLKQMRSKKFGVLAIKEKEKPGGEMILGGGPPALGAYASAVAYVLHREGSRNDDLLYVAKVLDEFPWNEEGWWASTIDVETGESKLPMSSPTIINKNAAIAMAAGIVSGYVRDIDSALAGRLKHKTDKCIYDQIIPAQEADGFWHYNLTDKDPNDKDVLGYFMLTTDELMNLQKFNPEYREERLNAALKKAQAFSLSSIAPMTEPNQGPPAEKYATRGTPSHYSLKENLKRSFQLGSILLGGGQLEEGTKIMDAAVDRFPIGNAGQDGAHAAEPSAMILSELNSH